MEESLIHKEKTYLRKLPQQVIKNAFGLFRSYITSPQPIRENWNRLIELPDGEKKWLKTNEEFFLYYEEPDTGGLISVYIRGIQAELRVMFSSDHNTVAVVLPSREHVENILRMFERAEEQLNISDPPKQNQIKGIIQEMQGLLTSAKTPTIFIGHGRDEQWRTLEGLLRRDKFNNIIYYESEYRAARSITDVLEEMLNEANIAVIVMTAEDKIAPDASEASPSITHRSRENVIHEAGLFQGRYGFNRAIILLEEGCNEFSNIKGLTQIHFKKGRIADKIAEVTGAIRREFPNN